LDNRAPITALLQSQQPIQNTPTAESIEQVRGDFLANPPVPGSPPIILLATDGLPDTCANRNPANQAEQDAANAASVAAAQTAFATGIKLFILFIGNDLAGSHPQRMANAGAGQDPITGTAMVYRANDPAELGQAFAAIIDDIRTCDLTLDAQVDSATAS